MPALPGPYAPNHGCTFELAIDEIPTIEPAPARAIAAAACLIVSMVPVMLRSRVRRHAAVSIWVIGPSVSEPPAHATTPVERAGGPAAAATAALDVVLVGHVGDDVLRRSHSGAAAARISSTAASRRDSVRPQMVTWAPSRANRGSHSRGRCRCRRR